MAGTATQELSDFAPKLPASGPRRSVKSQASMMRRTKAEGDRTVNDRDRCQRAPGPGDGLKR